MPQIQSKQNWLIRYKLYHLPFWFLYNYLWWVFSQGDPIGVARSIFFSPYTVKFSFYLVFQALAAYFNLYFLMPRYMEKGKFAQYITYELLTIIVAAMLIVPGYFLSAILSGKTMDDLYGSGPHNFFTLFLANPLPSIVASSTLAMSIKLTKTWAQTQKRQQMLEKEKLETELKFLKYQFNPHFLFNSINSIFFLIHKNPNMASASLAKFSELLRHQLYECNDQQIPLQKEIAYLENFIELEKLRHDTEVQADIALTTPFAGSLGIAPFILMTFVENAFKHVSAHVNGSNWISIKLELEGQRLSLFVSNSTAPGEANQAIKYGGIGLANVKRRLDLMYPGIYELDIDSQPDTFTVKLRLTLAVLQISPTMQMA
ncbi:histidine kinase [Mucilaginibacter sp. KACC 22773]|uniref:sensor histidine kinase n=1 Tax=Mucilaginibacter sp. KACC 22773 TaxID=3025671 RepID=UPI002365C532|nr:histidine kinase [Mucilaginibacter sp. KACC 22773]WDF80455.1 histidine kinase [Mucilaginibacter sp. KACC 22773]